jgi:hypothetical protein
MLACKHQVYELMRLQVDGSSETHRLRLKVLPGFAHGIEMQWPDSEQPILVNGGSLTGSKPDGLCICLIDAFGFPATICQHDRDINQASRNPWAFLDSSQVPFRAPHLKVVADVPGEKEPWTLLNVPGPDLMTSYEWNLQRSTFLLKDEKRLASITLKPDVWAKAQHKLGLRVFVTIIQAGHKRLQTQASAPGTWTPCREQAADTRRVLTLPTNLVLRALLVPRASPASTGLRPADAASAEVRSSSVTLQPPAVTWRVECPSGQEGVAFLLSLFDESGKQMLPKNSRDKTMSVSIVCVKWPGQRTNAAKPGPPYMLLDAANLGVFRIEDCIAPQSAGEQHMREYAWQARNPRCLCGVRVCSPPCPVMGSAYASSTCLPGSAPGQPA